MNIFLLISFNTCFGSSKNRFIETILLSTYKICFVLSETLVVDQLHELIIMLKTCFGVFLAGASSMRLNTFICYTCYKGILSNEMSMSTRHVHKELAKRTCHKKLRSQVKQKHCSSHEPQINLFHYSIIT